MSLFDFLKKEKADHLPKEVTFPVTLTAAAKGTFVPMEKIPDEVFSQGILGTCCGIDPVEGVVYAPVSGRVSQLSDTLHAIGIEGDGGVEILIHVGIDTVEMKGDGFTSKVKEGERVEQGQVLLTMDLEKIKSAGHPAVVITVVINSADFSSVKPLTDGELNPSDAFLCISK